MVGLSEAFVLWCIGLGALLGAAFADAQFGCWAVLLGFPLGGLAGPVVGVVCVVASGWWDDLILRAAKRGKLLGLLLEIVRFLLFGLLLFGAWQLATAMLTVRGLRRG